MLNSCNNTRDTSILYYKAISEYIKELPAVKSSCVSVSDTIVHLELTNFWEELSKDTSKSNDVLFMELDSIDNSRFFENYAMPQLQSFNQKASGDSCEYTLFFSKVYNNMVMAELINNRGNMSNNHHLLTSFNKSRIFLFRFDLEKKINKVYSKELEYD